MEGPAKDEADDEDTEGDWDVVMRHRKPTATGLGSSLTKITTSSTKSSVPGSMPLSKKARQNKAKREAMRAAKLDADVERDAARARYAREREMEEIKASTKGKGKKVSGAGVGGVEGKSVTGRVNGSGMSVWDA